MKQPLRVVGLFRELGPELSHLAASIHAAEGKLDPALSLEIAKYLDKGVQVLDVVGTSVDPLDPSVVIVGGASLVSDGAWVWRSDLSHYVIRYRVALPEEFVTYVVDHAPTEESEERIVQRWREAVEAYEQSVQGSAN